MVWGWCPSSRGQSVMEYALLIVVVVAAVVGMSRYLTLSIQANAKTLENRINEEAIGPTTPTP